MLEMFYGIKKLCFIKRNIRPHSKRMNFRKFASSISSPFHPRVGDDTPTSIEIN